jgi:hypothetical protein
MHSTKKADQNITRKTLNAFDAIFSTQVDLVWSEVAWCCVTARIVVQPLEEDCIAFLMPAPKCTNCIKQVLMLELSKTNF